jgi:lysophospholipase L1-like esterase
MGFRGPGLAPGSEASTRIAVFGDSFVFGWGVGDGETLPARLDQVLDSGSSRFHVMNLGIPGYGPGRSALLLRERALDLDPDVILLVVTESNDVLDDLQFARDPAAVAREGLGGLPGRSRLLQFVYDKSESFARWARMTRTENVSRTLRFIDEFAAVCAREEVPLVVALFPAKAQMRPSRVDALILRWLRVDARIHEALRSHVMSHPQITAAVDLREVLAIEGGEGGGPLFYPADGHPTPEAYRACAMALAPVIRKAVQKRETPQEP